MSSAPTPLVTDSLGPVIVVGAGRMGTALASALRGAGVEVQGPEGRGATGTDADVVLLAVPDRAIAEAAALISPGRLVGHVSGATTLDPLAPHEAFSLHPLTSVTSDRGDGARFAGATAAVAGTTDRARATAEHLATLLGMIPVRVDDTDRAAYHAAAAIAANFLVTLEGVAEELAATAGVDRSALVPLVETAVRNWAAAGAAGALTGPIARGDDAVTAAHRRVVAERMPQHLALFDALADATRALAADSPRDGSTDR